MPLTILLVGYPFAPVGEGAVGGAEQVLTMLDEGLTEAGHRSVVVAPEGSRTQGRLFATPAVDGPLDEATMERARARHHATIVRALRETGADLLHLHGVDAHRYLPTEGPPALVTLHLPCSWYPPEVFAPTRPRTFLHCVSASQARACPPGAPLLPVIPNGVRVDRFRVRGRKKGFALCLGRVCPEKGQHLALDAASRARVPLLLAGEVFRYAAHEAYFRTEILPRIAASRAHRFLGPIAGARKRRLLGAARCLLVPSLAPETSSLVALEALASGTPVVAFGAGALPELVEHGKTGFLVDGVEAMADAIGAASAIDARDCRAAVEERHAASRMIQDYLVAYRRVLG